MPETTYSVDATEFNVKHMFFMRMKAAGYKILMRQIHVCLFCEKPYKLNLPMRASKNHCSNEGCVMAYESDKAAVNRSQSRTRMRVLRAVC